MHLTLADTRPPPEPASPPPPGTSSRAAPGGTHPRRQHHRVRPPVPAALRPPRREQTGHFHHDPRPHLGRPRRRRPGRLPHARAPAGEIATVQGTAAAATVPVVISTFVYRAFEELPRTFPAGSGLLPPRPHGDAPPHRTRRKRGLRGARPHCRRTAPRPSSPGRPQRLPPPRLSIVPANLPGSGFASPAAHAATEFDPDLDWSVLAWLRSVSTLPILVRGILTGSDAALAVDAGGRRHRLQPRRPPTRRRPRHPRRPPRDRRRRGGRRPSPPRRRHPPRPRHPHRPIPRRQRNPNRPPNPPRPSSSRSQGCPGRPNNPPGRTNRRHDPNRHPNPPRNKPNPPPPHHPDHHHLSPVPGASGVMRGEQDAVDIALPRAQGSADQTALELVEGGLLVPTRSNRSSGVQWPSVRT